MRVTKTLTVEVDKDDVAALDNIRNYAMEDDPDGGRLVKVQFYSSGPPESGQRVIDMIVALRNNVLTGERQAEKRTSAWAQFLLDRKDTTEHVDRDHARPTVQLRWMRDCPVADSLCMRLDEPKAAQVILE